ncbi:hypothetical protein AK88_02169 [Plasmodium fragile]|uniref:RAP domain-containing protein n=1 Tax=Plasmodium fragile TaxID=5857 RepID=A0A0D9QN66_PLAFR|nr:uncharacterized protein AK88_02169 [Plasmodium fragile]KJP88222.1 hypothetical protein AK88_02169 [Plasmodium fragile]
MYLLKKRFELNHVGRISSVALLRNPPLRSLKIRVKNFAYARSIYECSTLEAGVKHAHSSPGVSVKTTLAPKFLPHGSDASSKYNENLRSVFFSNSMDEVKDYFDNNFNEMKNHEYVYLLFKMYEIIFLNFYKTYESCDILRLDNPQFKFITLDQYVDDWVGRYGRSSRKRDIATVGQNEIIFYENDEQNGICDKIFDSEGCIAPKHVSHGEDAEHKTWNDAERLNGGNREMHHMEEHAYVVDTANLDGTANHSGSKYYSPQVNLNTLMDIHLNYVQYIEKLNIKESTWKDYVSSFMTEKYEELYRNVLNVIYKRIFFFSCKDIINYLYVTKRINLLSIREVSMLAENVILQNIKYLDEDSLVKIGYIYLNNSNKEKNIHHIGRYGSKNFLETYLSLVQIKIKSMSNENFVKILEYVSSNNYKHIQIFRDLKTEVYKRHNNLTQEQMVKLFFLYSQNMNAADDILMRNFLKAIVDIFSHEGEDCQKERDLDKLDQIDKLGEEGKGERHPAIGIPLSVLLNGIWTSAKHFKDYPVLLVKSEKVILENIKNFSASTVSMLIWAYSTVEGKNPQVQFSNELYFELKERALELHQHMTPKQLSNSVLGLAITVGRTVSWDGRVDTEMHDVVEQHLLRVGGGTEKGVSRVGRQPKVRVAERTFLNLFTSEDLSNLCYAYSLVRSGSRELHSLIQSAILKNQSDLSPQEIAKIAYAYGNMYFYASYTLLSSLQYEILQRMHQFSHHEICDILWCYCVNRFLDANFWKCMLRAIDMEKLRDSRCCLLYSCLSYVNLIDSSILDSYNTLRVFHLVIEHYWRFQMAEYLHRFADDVVDAMYKENTLVQVKSDRKGVSGEQGMEANMHGSERDHPFKCVKKAYDYEGFLIDIYFEHMNKRYAVFLYSALNTSSDGYPLGESVLKARYLRRKNIRTVHLLHSIWSECRGNRIDLIYAQL